MSTRLARLLPLALVLLVGGKVLASDVGGNKVHGVELIPWAKQVGEDRYESPRDWANTIRFYKKLFAGWRYIKWHNEVNLPGVKYIHIENTFAKRTYDGLNIYELPGGHVRIFVLKHVEPEAAAAPGGAAAGEGAPGSTSPAD